VELVTSKNPKLALVEGYGTTEASPIIAINPPDAPKEGSIGKILPNIDYRIINYESGEVVPDGSPGELVVSGPSIFSGYYRSDSNPFITIDGKRFYRTGDEVIQDPQRYIFITGRYSRRFKGPGSEMVNMQMIEEGLLAQKIFAKKADQTGPTLAIEVVETGGVGQAVMFSTVPISLEEVQRIQRDVLRQVPAWLVREVILVENIALLGTGKPNYRALKEILKSRNP
jgi:acyl-CoA synthetase (AMP-forming)/AMP-acid ligase II